MWNGNHLIGYSRLILGFDVIYLNLLFFSHNVSDIKPLVVAEILFQFKALIPSLFLICQFSVKTADVFIETETTLNAPWINTHQQSTQS